MNGTTRTVPLNDGDQMDIDANPFRPPPSTLAAQLVSNISSTHRPSIRSSDDSFNLLAALIKKFEALPEDEKVGEELVNHNRRTVYILTSAILDKTSTGRKSVVGNEEDLEQAAQAIDALITAVEATPIILVLVAEEDDLVDTGAVVPLWVWLWPRLLRLLGKNGTEGLWDKIVEFFECAFSAVRSRQTELWGLDLLMAAYLRQCAEAALLYVDAITSARLPLPFACDSFGCGGSQDVVQEQCTYTLKNGLDAFRHVDIILRLLVNLFCPPTGAVVNAEDINDLHGYTMWIFESFLELRTKAAQASVYADQQEEVRTCSMAIKTVDWILQALDRQLTEPVKRKGYRVLTRLIDEFASFTSRFSDILSVVELCTILLRLGSACTLSASLSQLVYRSLLPGLMHFVDAELERIDLDYSASDLISSVTTLGRSCESWTKPDAERKVCEFENEKPINQVRVLKLEKPEEIRSQDEPPTKRQKVEAAGLDTLSEIYDWLEKSLQISTNTVESLSDNFLHLSEAERLTAIELLGHALCAAARTLSMTWDSGGEIGDSECTVCDLLEAPPPLTEDEIAEDKNGVIYRASWMARVALSAVTETPEFDSSQKVRIFAMISLRKLALHVDDAEVFDFERSELGKWCFSSLSSKSRELRVAAGRTLPAFLRDSGDSLISRKNRVFALDALKQISEQSPIHLTETMVLAWGQIAAVSKNRELNFALLRLVEYLGHSHEVILAAASNEIVNTAEAHGVSLPQLFNPFWGTIAYRVVKDLHSRPQLTQSVADLLSMTVPDLLVLTQTHALPWLVLEEGRDVISRIAQARGDGGGDEAVVRNLPVVLSRLLTQSKQDIETYIIDLMNTYGLKFNENELTIYLRSVAVQIASELLKQAGDEADNSPSRARHALNFLATQCSNSASDKKKRRPIGMFLEQHGLGIMSHFSDVLNDANTWQSSTEKIRCLRAVEEMVTVGRSHVHSALPQIYACLQSALTNEELRPTAFHAWGTLIKSLDDDDVVQIVESTFATIIQYWDVFDVRTRKYAQDLVDNIVGRLASWKPTGMGSPGLVAEQLPSLAAIPDLARYQTKIDKQKQIKDMRNLYSLYKQRIATGSASVATHALRELADFLRKHQEYLQASAVSEQPDSIIGALIRAILDTNVKFNGSNLEVARLSGECLGLIGALDPNMVENTVDRQNYVALSNFEEWDDTLEFVVHLLQHVLVKAFVSAASTKVQNFLSFTMQDLLFKTGITGAIIPQSRKGSNYSDERNSDELNERWNDLPESVRTTLTPFLRSKYKPPISAPVTVSYPVFDSKKSFKVWIRSLTRGLLEKPLSPYADSVFPPLALAVKVEDTSVANFVLPYVVLHSVALGSDDDRQNIYMEILAILDFPSSETKSHAELTNLKLCSEAIFRILDYLALWLQEKNNPSNNPDKPKRSHALHLRRVKELLDGIPAEVISHRAVECKSYARALSHWEAFIRKVQEQREPEAPVQTDHLEHLQRIYTQIDEPDGIEGISAHLHVLDIDQQVLGHRKAGRWTAAQSWYEIKIAENPGDVGAQVDLLHCMKESGQHDVLLNYVEGIMQSTKTVQKLLPFATEASWATGRWDMLQKFVSIAPNDIGGDFNVSVGRGLLALHSKDYAGFSETIDKLREHIAGAMSTDNTTSLRACHDSMLRLHVLSELVMIARPEDQKCGPEVLQSLDRRLEVIGAYVHDKQYVLGLRRAAMQLSSGQFIKSDIASAWLTSARLARKDNSIPQSFNAVLHATNLGDQSATIEHARLIWKEGHHRKAIRNLEGAIANNVFTVPNGAAQTDQGSILAVSTMGEGGSRDHSLPAARANLLLAKWLDRAAQTSTIALRQQYQKAAQLCQSWERGHYYLGRHYNKLLEAQKLLPRSQQNDNFIIGEMGKIVIENYLRSLNYGTKYVYQTLPRIITLWLDLGMEVHNGATETFGTPEANATVQSHRRRNLEAIHAKFSKYVPKMPAYIFYTALPQIVARIAHPHRDVFQKLKIIISKVVEAHPRQSLWALLAVGTSTQPDRKARGAMIMRELIANSKASELGNGALDMKTMITRGQRLSSELLGVCNNGDLSNLRRNRSSLTKTHGFKARGCLPSTVAAPIESAMTATLPTLTGSVRKHEAFSRDVVTIDHFEDSVLIMNSLAKPRKLVAIGSDGNTYCLLCKPKDDLRKDQRLMEFNGMINRSLKRDAESSKRQLYIKTYAVTPLNEECGIIQWVDGLTTLRDILVHGYTAKGQGVNYTTLKVELAQAAAESDEAKRHILFQRVLNQFRPPVFHDWFKQRFPEPNAWFNARLRYTRSAAVMSMIGTILGLGDRHGENILFQEGNGGTFHVDFNCLFDKGQTFSQPEKVPFRLTHNMVDAMGVYGYEGPFRTSCELTLKVVRQHEETLMTILESFLYDPTLDLLETNELKRTTKKMRDKKKDIPPFTAQGVLDVIKRKIRGLMADETVPLGVEGQVDALIEQAVSELNLASMYIGWCAFF